MAIEFINRKKGKTYKAILRINGDKITKTFLRKIDAEAWEREMLVKRSSGGFKEGIGSSKITLNEFRVVFLRDYANSEQSPSTLKMEGDLYRIHIEPALGIMKINDIDDLVVRKLLNHLTNDYGLSNERANRVRQILNCMFNRALEWKYVKLNPVASIKKLSQKTHSKEQAIQFWTEDEVNRLIQWLKENDPWLMPKVLFQLTLGTRLGEMKSVTAKDMIQGFKGAYIHVSKSYCRHSKQLLKETKSGTSRSLPIGGEFYKFLLDLTKGKDSNSPLLFESWDECKCDTKLNKHFRKAIRATGVRRIRWHDMRHTFAVRFLEKGGTLYDLQNLLGHHSIKLTERYSHFSPLMSERSRGRVDYRLAYSQSEQKAVEECVVPHLSPTIQQAEIKKAT